MTDRSTEPSGGKSPAPDRSIDDTASRPAVSAADQADTEQTKVHDLPRVTDESPAPAKPSLTEAARSKFEAAKQAVPVPGRGPAAEERPPPRGPRRARLRLTRIDPWSVMKNAFLLSIAFAVVTVVAVGMVWQVLGAAGVWESINDTVQSGIGGEDVESFQVEDYVGTSRVLGFTMLVAAIDVVLITAAATLTAFLYNMAAALLGGVEVTLSEDVD